MANEKRLIDANQLREVLLVYLKSTHDMDELVFDNCFPYWVVSKAIKTAPTVDAVEVVHAHWEDGCAVDPKTERIIYKSIDCSHCEEVFKIESETREYWKDRFKVCPFCGAIMDGGNEDG